MRELRVLGAAEHNLRDVDVVLPGGITAVVGVSGSGKSSLVFDTVYHEARRRFLETVSLGSPRLRSRPARVRDIQHLRPAVAVAQNVVNLNPASTVATAVGVHPFLRILYARFARRSCPACGEPATVTTLDGQVTALRDLTTATGAAVDVLAPLVRGVDGTHAHLLAHLARELPRGAVEVDGRRWAGRRLDPDRPHDITVHIGTAKPGDTARALRELLDRVAALGAHQVLLRADGQERAYSRAALCVRCGGRLPTARPADFSGGTAASPAYRLGGRTLAELLSLDVDAVLGALGVEDLPPGARRAADQVRQRLSALSALGLGYLTLDRPSPTLSRGEAQRVRLAVILANDLEDVLHVLDEPTIGLDPGQVGALMRELGRLRGPVLLVEHDAAAVAAADHVVELGPDAGSGGGQVVFAGPPADLWRAPTASGRWFSGPARLDVRPGATAKEHITVRGARRHNLAGFDCSFPVGAFTVVAGPSGAGKTTLVRDVLVASLSAGAPTGCAGIDGPRLRPTFVDQSPIGRNPRSNPATYTGLAERIRSIFAAATGRAGSAFSFNRPDGACPACAGMGAIEVRLRYLPSEWMACEACQGRRFGDDVRDVRVRLADGGEYTIVDVYAATVDEAAALLASDARAARIVRSLRDVGLGYVRLGQPSPTLSGGEAQRVKLAKHLSARADAQLVFLDEPTTGLHPANLAQLVATLRSLVDGGATVVAVEHQPAVVAAADWVIRLGPGGGPAGGRLIHHGPSAGGGTRPAPPRRSARAGRPGRDTITVTGATSHNLKHVSVSFPKSEVSAVVGVSGSGKSSLVSDVLAAEATRRLLECLSVYERQSVREGPEADVRSIDGLGPTIAVDADRRLWNPRGTVGTATELSFHLGVLLAYAGARRCPECGAEQRRGGAAPNAPWPCAGCGGAGPPVAPADFSPATYEAACPHCHGLGTVPVPRLDRLVVRPERPINGGALYSPGFFPESYLSKPANGGYWMLQALAERYGFDPAATPWERMSDAAREAFLYGEEEVRLPDHARRAAGKTVLWRGVLRILSTWDVGGLYTDQRVCPECAGARLRPRFLDVHLAGMNRHALHHEPAEAVGRALAGVSIPDGSPSWVGRSLAVAVRRLEFLGRVGLGYVHLDRLAGTLSAGEVQRTKLTAMLGSELTGVTVLLDEPSRGLHPSETVALAGALAELRAAGNTVICVDHDARLVASAGHVVVLGPGAGRAGGSVVAAGPPADVRRHPSAAPLLDAPVPARAAGPRREPTSWMYVREPRENNLRGEDIALPLGVLAGLCGVSGSGKSTLAIDIVARALAPVRLTSSVAYEEIRPGAHRAIEGAPPRAVHADQGRAGITSPGAYLGVLGALRRAYAASDEAGARGIGPDDLVPRCDACKGRGSVREDMGFLPSIEQPCDVCEATGYRAEVRELAVRGHSLAGLAGRTLDELAELWGDLDTVARPLDAAARLGLGYLTLDQRSRALSGGERQRLKLARELARPAGRPTLYLLDEPTTGLHALDVERLVTALDDLVARGHSALVVDHDPALLACCDHLVELGPAGGPGGGRVVASGTPENLAAGATPTAPYLREVLR